MGSMHRKELRRYDLIAVGDVVDLGGNPRKVLEVTKDERGRVRWIGVNRLRCGVDYYHRKEDGTRPRYCTGPVYLYHTDLHSTDEYRFRGWVKLATPETGDEDG